MAKKKKKKKRRLRLKRVLVFLIVIILLGYFLFLLLNRPLSNIYIKGNYYLTEQEIMEYVGIDDYPKLLDCQNYKLAKKLNNNKFVKKVKIYKQNFTDLYIIIEENRPLYYDSTEKKTILLDRTKVNKIFEVPTLINYIPDTKLVKFQKKLEEIDTEILKRISDIEYKPNDVDKNRLLLTMNDGNYVYITINKLPNINNYINIIKEFNGKKGILYLDSGEYFKIMED